MLLINPFADASLNAKLSKVSFKPNSLGEDTSQLYPIGFSSMSVRSEHEMREQNMIIVINRKNLFIRTHCKF